MKLVLVGALIFLVAVAMTMVGKGGGNFYIVILSLAGVPMHKAAATGQFILFCASVAAMIVFHRGRSASWHLALIVGALTSLSAFVGGYLSHIFADFTLKMIFAGMLIFAGALMLIPVKERTSAPHRGFGILDVRIGEEKYPLNLKIAVPVTVLTGFAAGMVGVSGGSFLVPLMVLACGVPVHIAVGTSSILVAATAFMGFAGHALRGDFDPHLAIPLAVITIFGGTLGGKFALKSKPHHLKRLFAYTNFLAAGFMLFNALRTGGII